MTVGCGLGPLATFFVLLTCRLHCGDLGLGLRVHCTHIARASLWPAVALSVEGPSAVGDPSYRAIDVEFSGASRVAQAAVAPELKFSIQEKLHGLLLLVASANLCKGTAIPLGAVTAHSAPLGWGSTRLAAGQLNRRNGRRY